MANVQVLLKKESKSYDRIFGNRLKELARAMQKDIEVDIHHGEELPVGTEYDNTKLSILIWASHKTDDMLYSEKDTAFGKKFCNDALFVPTEGLLQFKDEEIVLAEYDEEQIVLSFLYDMWEYESADEIDLFNIIIDQFIVQLFGNMEEYNAKLEDATRIENELSIKRAVGNLMQTIKQDKQNLEDRVRDTKVKLTDFMAKAKQYSMMLISQEAQLDGLKLGEEGIKTKLLKEIETIKNNKKVEEIFFADNGNLLIDTGELFVRVVCEDKKVRRYRMGRYRIDVNLGNGAVKFFNRNIENIRKSMWDNCHHPHVNPSGNGCLGNASTLIAECIMNREWAILADVLINYLESVNIDDGAGIYYTNWDEVDAEGKTLTQTWTNGRTVDESRNKEEQQRMIRQVRDGLYVAGIKY
jgi:hypothetical protein